MEVYEFIMMDLVERRRRYLELVHSAGTPADEEAAPYADLRKEVQAGDALAIVRQDFLTTLNLGPLIEMRPVASLWEELLACLEHLRRHTDDQVLADEVQERPRTSHLRDLVTTFVQFSYKLSDYLHPALKDTGDEGINLKSGWDEILLELQTQAAIERLASREPRRAVLDSCLTDIVGRLHFSRPVGREDSEAYEAGLIERRKAVTLARTVQDLEELYCVDKFYKRMVGFLLCIEREL
ncbi:hypothetical protein HK101_010405, partial [Irineochytrium annulatum]